jgi:DNA-binding cell septation regulator SpoVG
MQITEVKIFPTDERNLLAYADVIIDNCFRVRDLQIFRRPKGYLVTMPQVKQEHGKYREIAFAINRKTRKMIEDTVIAEYKKVTGNPVTKARP